MATLRTQDAISGKEGKAIATINGSIVELFYLTKLEATLDKNKTEVKTVGRRATGHKATSTSGKGTLSILYMTSTFRQLVSDYHKTGKDVYFSIQVINEDPASATGKQVTVLKNVNLDSVMVASLDADADDVLKEDMDFTFEDFDILTSFNTII